jgi:hypothetical protein
LGLALALLASGPLLAWSVAPRCGILHAAVAACAVVYDLVGRGALRGPMLLAACRGGNFAVGLALASVAVPFPRLLLLAPLAYGGYVFSVARLARLEDSVPAEAELRPAGALQGMLLTFLSVGGVAAFLALCRAAPGDPWNAWRLAAPVALVLASSVGLARRALELRRRPFRPADVEQVAGMGLRRLLVATAALALGAATWDGAIVAVLILGGYPLSHALRRVFPPS